MDFSFLIYRSVPSQKLTLAKVDAAVGHKYIVVQNDSDKIVCY